MADAAVRSGGAGSSDNGPGMGTRLVNFYHGVIAEMKKVTWPDMAQVRSASIAIIIFVLVISLVITLLDFVLKELLITLIPSFFGQ